MEKSSDKTADIFDNWFQTQRAYLEKWAESNANLQKSFPGLDWSKGTAKDPHDLFSLYNTWRDTVGKYFDVSIKNQSFEISKDTISKLFNGADAYVKLYEFWEPLIKAMQERATEGGSYEDVWDPSTYKEMMDKVFGFSTPETLMEFYGQSSKLVETWGGKGQLFVQPWADAIKKNMDAFLDLAAGDTDASMSIFHNIYSAFEATAGKAFKVPAVGKNREEVETLLKTMDRYSVFLAKNTEFQHTIYQTGQKAMEEVVEAIAKKIKADGEITHFDEFFKLWATINEKDFLALFKTVEFSKLQGMVLDAALEARKSFHQLMEMFLSDFPIPLRSEMDDLYKTVYNTKKDVRELRRLRAEVGSLNKEMVDLKKQIRTLQRKKTPDVSAMKKEVEALREKIDTLGGSAKGKGVKEVTQ